MELHDYTENNGIIPIQLGDARIIVDNINILHLINISKFPTIITELSSTVERQFLIVTNNNRMRIIFEGRVKITRRKITTLTETLNHILPRHKNRQKRGIHIIFGDITQADTTEIQEAINKITTNENTIINKINEQVLINTQMITRFKILEIDIEKQNKIIETALDTFRNTTSDIYEINTFELFIHETEFTIDMLQKHLDEILNSLILAKQNYISHYLMNKQEVETIIDLLNQQSVMITSEYQLYQFLTIEILFKEPFIIFSVSIPKFSMEKFKYVLITQVTINDTFSINIPPSQNIIYNDHRILYLHKQCNKIEKTYYCIENETEKTDDQCILNILLNKPALCDFVQTHARKLISKIKNQYIIINTKNKEEYNTTCGVQQQRKLPKIALIKFKNCTITINNITISNKQMIYEDDTTHLKPFHEVIPKLIIESIEIPHLTNWTIQNKQKLDHLKEISIPSHHHQTFWSLTTIIITTIIGYLIIQRYCPTCTPCAWYKSIKSTNDQLDVEDNVHLTGEQLRIMDTTPRVEKQPSAPIFPILNNIN